MTRHTATDVGLIAGVYLLVHGWMLLNNGAYWDDWLIVYGSAETIGQLFSHSGLPMFTPYYLFLNHGGVFAYRLLVFLSYLAAALCFYAILRSIGDIDRKTALVLALVFLLFPSNSARISVMASRITLSYALFFAGFWLVSVYLARQTLLPRIAALALLFASFFTHSLLVLYGVVLIYIAWQRRTELASPAAAGRLALRHLDFILLPVAFWVMKLIWFEPYGTYEDYNRVTAEGALHAFSLAGSALHAGFLEPILESLLIWPALIVPAAIMVVLGARFLRSIPEAGAPPRHRAGFLLFGLIAFTLAVFPYLAVGKIPASGDWLSRHQLLIPLGASFMLVYSLLLVPGERARDLACALVVVLFAAGAVRQWMDFQTDWYKQVALIENFKASPGIRRANYILVEDQTRDLDANRRVYRHYEYAGLFRAAFGDERRLAQDSRMLRLFPFSRLRDDINSVSLLGQYDLSVTSPDTYVGIEHGPLRLTAPEVIRLRLLEATDERQFRARMGDALRLSVVEGIAVTWKAGADGTGAFSITVKDGAPAGDKAPGK